MNRNIPATRKLYVLGTALIGAILLAAPAQAQRTSLNSLDADHDGLAADHDDIQAAIGALGAPADTGRTPISDCGTVDTPGSHVVTQNLVANGDCLEITVDNVTIDLNGFTLTGDGTGRGITTNGSDFVNRLNIAVRNGTVTGFEDGVILLFNKGAVVEGVRAVGNGDDGLVSSRFSTVTGSTAQGNTDDGIRAGVGSTVHGNTVFGNGDDGLVAGFGSTVTGNTARGNGGNGLFVNCPANVIGNTATDNTDPNLGLFNAGLCNLANNLAP